MLPAALADIIYTACGGRQYAANNFPSLRHGHTERVKKVDNSGRKGQRKKAPCKDNALAEKSLVRRI
jgi:hypothetical protein